MKRRIVIAMLCVMMGLVGCSGSKESDNTAKDETVVDKGEDSNKNTEKADEDKSDKSDESSKNNAENNTSKAYPGSDSVVDITMGANENGNQVALYNIKVPTSYYMASLYMDEKGNVRTMLETNGKLVSQIIEAGGLDNLEELCNSISLDAPGGTSNTYSISVLPVEDYSVEYEKDLTPGGLDIETKDGHTVYVCYDSSEQSDFVFAYQINDKWTLLIQNKGQLKDQMSLEEFGQEMCQLITPIE